MKMRKKLPASIMLEEQRLNSLYQKVSHHIDGARQAIQKAINTEMIQAYWLIGRDIVEEEQQGQERAKYGKAILKALSLRLQARYKTGFSVDLLERARKFFLLFPLKESNSKSATLSRKLMQPLLLPNLSWSHYVELTKVSHEEVR